MKNLIVMSSGHERLFRKCYEKYSKHTGEEFDFLIIPDNKKQIMSFVEYIMFKNDIFGQKNRFYSRFRSILVQYVDRYDRVIFYNLSFDGVFLIDDYVYRHLKGRDCRVTFMDPMQEISGEFRYWDLFTRIFTCEYSDIELYAKPRSLKIQFVPWCTKFDIYEPISKIDVYDICFIGLGTAERLKYLEEVAKYCTINGKSLFVAGHFWHNSNWVASFVGKWKFRNKYTFLTKYVANGFIAPEDAFKIFCRSKICININTLGHRTFNGRNIDAMYAGSTAVTEKEDMSGYEFIDGQHYYSCSSPEEMVQTIDMLLNNEKKLIKCRDCAKVLVEKQYGSSSIIRRKLQ